MKLITTEEQLRSIIPNVISTVNGEVALFEKMRPHLEDAEKWYVENFTSEKTFNTIAGYTNENTVKILSTQIVCFEAYRRAIPSLDLILTPNGFGVVNNSNLSPASKERVERLIEQLITNRDYLLSLVLPMLYAASGWKTTTQCAYFGSTLFPNITLGRYVDNSKPLWDYYQQLREQLIIVETWISDNFLSSDLMEKFRSEVQSNTIPQSHTRIIRVLQSLELRILKTPKPEDAMHFERDMLTELVDIIRKDETSFPEWHNSKLKEVFNPPVFENKKESSGYFF